MDWPANDNDIGDRCSVLLGVNIGNVRALGEAEWTLFYYVSLMARLDWVKCARGIALVIAGVLSGYYALIRLILGRMYARFFDISSIGTIVLWIGFWPYELHMQHGKDRDCADSPRPVPRGNCLRQRDNHFPAKFLVVAASQSETLLAVI